MDTKNLRHLRGALVRELRFDGAEICAQTLAAATSTYLNKALVRELHLEVSCVCAETMCGGDFAQLNIALTGAVLKTRRLCRKRVWRRLCATQHHPSAVRVGISFENAMSVPNLGGGDFAQLNITLTGSVLNTRCLCLSLIHISEPTRPY